MRHPFFSKLARTAASALAFAVAAGVHALTLDELKQMVKELEAIAVKHPDYAYPIECEIVDRPVINAHATAIYRGEGEKPQAKMVVFTGLVDFLKDDKDLIRAVVAHEVSHLACGHVSPTEPVARDLSQFWTRTQELEADATGAMLLQRSGHSKDHMAQMLLKLDEARGRTGSWINRLSGTHPDPKERASRFLDDPRVVRSVLEFDMGLAFMEARRFLFAAEMFKKAAQREPAFKEAWVNAGLASLMDYFDKLPVAIHEKWLRPDFGPAILEVSLTLNRDPEIRAEDRARYQTALASIAAARTNAAGHERLDDLEGLAWVLDPEAQRINAGVEMLTKWRPSEDETRLRKANNIALGLQRLGKNREAAKALVEATKATDEFNASVGENLGRLGASTVVGSDAGHAAEMLKTWLELTPSLNQYYGAVKKEYEAVCKSANLQAVAIQPAPAYLCRVVSMMVDGKEVSRFLPIGDLVAAMGKADIRLKFDDRYPNLNEWRWQGGQFTCFSEDPSFVMRLTSYLPGSYVVLRTVDEGTRTDLRITVGMSEDEFGKVLNPKGGLAKPLAKGGQTEDWLYYPGLQLGVLIKDGKVAGITTTPVQDDED